MVPWRSSIEIQAPKSPGTTPALMPLFNWSGVRSWARSAFGAAPVALREWTVPVA